MMDENEVASEVVETAEEVPAAAESAAAEPAAADTALEVHEADDEGFEFEEDESDTDDSLTYANGVIEKIVAMATREVPHILGMKGNFFNAIQEQFGAESLTKGVSVDVTDDNRVIVNISVIIEYGSYAPQIFEDVKERVTERLASMTGLEVAGINLRIENVVTREEYEKAQRRLINTNANRKADEGKDDAAAEPESAPEDTEEPASDDVEPEPELEEPAAKD